MNKQTELEIRAQAMITCLGQQRTEAMDQVIYAKAEIAIRDATIKDLENQIEAMKTPADPPAA